ncbi:ImuA family protein [Aquabacter spiritensis]|uniref:Protein ImuA n=1 Tax=Aquabacter spiritensis TaxID=933073 RepID=A0A4R3LYA3_9HYPH|nr:hypothetical protein [Aquabacter spiritensis]TCT05632.1 hypothetical protein EDC64_104189 [Aquabacter spiritensis]
MSPPSMAEIAGLRRRIAAIAASGRIAAVGPGWAVAGAGPNDASAPDRRAPEASPANPERDTPGRDTPARDAPAGDGPERPGRNLEGPDQDGTGQDGTGQDGPDQDGAGQDGADPGPADGRRLAFGVADLDRSLGGGLAFGTLHEAAAAAIGAEATLAAFGLGLAAMAARLRRRPVLVVQQDLAGFEAGGLYGPGLAEMGLPEGRILLVRVRRTQDVLLVMEEASRCVGLSAVLGETAAPVPDLLTATRRLALAARAGGTLSLLLRQARDSAPCAAATRWLIAPRPSRPQDAYGGLGPVCLSAALTRNRLGPPGEWELELRAGGFAPAPPREARHEPRIVLPGAAPLSRPVAGAPVDGPHRTALGA